MLNRVWNFLCNSSRTCLTVLIIKFTKFTQSLQKKVLLLNYIALYFKGPQLHLKNQRNISIISKVGRANRRSVERKFAASSTIAIMTAGFYVCWSPYAIKCILSIVNIQVSVLPSIFAVLITKLEVIINPIIYIFSNNQVTYDLIFTLST